MRPYEDFVTATKIERCSLRMEEDGSKKCVDKLEKPFNLLPYSPLPLIKNT